MRTRDLCLLLAFSFLLTGCTLRPPQTQDTNGPQPTNIIIKEESMTPTPSVTELKIEDLYGGTGTEAKDGDLLRVHYVGTLLDGTKFDSSVDRGKPFEFTLGKGEVIRGWDVGLRGMQVGARRRLTIPPQFAYGERGMGNLIAPNTTLVFVIDIIAINPPK